MRRAQHNILINITTPCPRDGLQKNGEQYHEHKHKCRNDEQHHRAQN